MKLNAYCPYLHTDCLIDQLSDSLHNSGLLREAELTAQWFPSCVPCSHGCAVSHDTSVKSVNSVSFPIVKRVSDLGNAAVGTLTSVNLLSILAYYGMNEEKTGETRETQ
jgi:hypothetical protein